MMKLAQPFDLKRLLVIGMMRLRVGVAALSAGLSNDFAALQISVEIRARVASLSLL